MQAIDGNLALKEDTIAYEASTEGTENQSERQEGRLGYLIAKCDLRSEDLETSASPATVTIKLEPYIYSDYLNIPNWLSPSIVLNSEAADTGVEKAFTYTLDYGDAVFLRSEHLESTWFKFCESLFPGYREHTVEERKAYSDFIDSFFEEIEI